LLTKVQPRNAECGSAGPITEGPSFVEETCGASDMSSNNNGLERAPTRANSRGLVRAGVCLGLGQRNNEPSQSLGYHPVHICVSRPLSPLRYRSTSVVLSIMERQRNEAHPFAVPLSRAVARPRCHRRLGRLIPLPLRGSVASSGRTLSSTATQLIDLPPLTEPAPGAMLGAED
jgi:hypothetical protein